MGLIAFAVGLYALINHLSVIGSVFHFLTDLLQPLIVGAILAFFLNVPMRGLEKLLLRLQTKRRWKVRERANEVISLIVTYVGGFLLIFLVLYIVIPQLVETIPGIISSAEAAWPRLLIAFYSPITSTPNSWSSCFSNFDLGPLLTKVWENYAQIIQTSLTAVSSVASVLTITITGFVISIYILSNKKKLLSQVRSVLYAYVGRKYADKISEVAVLTNQTFSSFISGQCVEAVILGVMFFLVMSILGLPYSLVISVFIAFMALIPYVGAFLGCVVGMLLIVIVSPHAGAHLPYHLPGAAAAGGAADLPQGGG